MRQAGFVVGLILLLVLCAVTDWTIRLIVINAKLSGRNSYIDIMNHCFGPSGRAAVSFFQFAFAFGGMSYCSPSAFSCNNDAYGTGMCAFGIIIGEHPIHLTCPSLTLGKVTLYHMSSVLYSPPSRRYPSSPFSPSANSSSPSAPSASRTRSRYTERSTSSRERPSSHSSAW